MSLFVFVIAACHGLPPVAGAVVGKSKFAVMAGAAVGALIAVAFGRSAYAVLDLIGVGLGTWMGWSLLQASTSSADQRASQLQRRRDE